MRVLEWRETARADLLAIVDYISDDNPDAAQQLKDDIEAKVQLALTIQARHRPLHATQVCFTNISTPTKSPSIPSVVAVQTVSGADLITDEPVSRLAPWQGLR